MDGWVLPEAALRDAPVYAPRPHELGDAELILSGAYAPLEGFLGPVDLAAIAARARLADGTRWPVPVTLEVPSAVLAGIDPADPGRRALLLTEPDGSPVVGVEISESWPLRDGVHGVAGPVLSATDRPRGPFARLRLPPAEAKRTLPPGRVLGIFADRPLHRPQLAQLALAARTLAGSVVVLIPVGASGPDGLAPEALVRAVLAARDRMPPATLVVVPVAARGDEIRDGLLRARVATAYGVTHLLASGDLALSGGGTRVMVPRELAYDTRDGQWRGRDDIPPRNRRAALSITEIHDMLDRGTTLPDWHTPPAVARELSRAFPPRRHRGVVIFFTGPSGAGKSALSRAVADIMAESGERTLTRLGGTIVRRELSAGAAEDDNRYVRRIGWVAAEAARHGGMVLCTAIAANPRARAAARALVRAAGAGFILVHVTAPEQVCASRKAAYPRTGAGEAGGVEAGYQPADDAELMIDTSGTPLAESVDRVIGYLVANGWIDPRHG